MRSCAFACWRLSPAIPTAMTATCCAAIPSSKWRWHRSRDRRCARSRPSPASRTCRGARNSIAWRCSTCIATVSRSSPATSPWISTKASIGASRNCASSMPITMTFCRSTSSTPAAGWSCPCCGRRRHRAQILTLVKRVVGHLRERFPRVRIRLRGDSHYACPEVMTLRSLCDRVQRTRKRGCAAGARPRHRVHLRPVRKLHPGGAGPDA